MYKYKYIILFLIVVFLICYYNLNTIVEGYDASIPNISLTQCGTECTNRMRCVGFGYKPIGGVCYISNSTIFGEPNDKLFSNEYSKLDRRCNKINKITDEDAINSKTLTENSIYMCADGEHNIYTRYQYANYGATSLDKYGTTIFDASDTDIIKPEEIKYYLNKNTIKQDNDYISDFITDPNKIKYKFIETSDEIDGSDVPGRQCIVNVSLYDCLSNCKNNDLCVGAEWNKHILLDDNEYENICCQKSTINNMMPRKEQFKKGKFYIKTKVDNITNDDTIVITNTEKKDINNRFNIYIPEINKSN
jgi:hypothetical protein